MLIAIDHGNKLIKTVNCPPFTSGLVESDVKPFGKDVLRYRGKYYRLSEQRIPYRRDKTDDERFFILTLFAIAREIEASGSYTTGCIGIRLAVGLPPAHFGAQHQAFTQYFLGRGAVNFTYRDRPYCILIEDAVCFPQSYAAAVTVLAALKGEPKALVLDIGGFTADYIRIQNGEGKLDVCDSLENGVILLYNKIKSQVSAEQDVLLDEAEIDAVLREEQTQTRLPTELTGIIERQAQGFVGDLFNTLRERGIELKTGKVVLVGGGAILLRRYIETSGKISIPVFVDDIRANAKGYDLLCKAGIGVR